MLQRVQVWLKLVKILKVLKSEMPRSIFTNKKSLAKGENLSKCVSSTVEVEVVCDISFLLRHQVAWGKAGHKTYYTNYQYIEYG